MSFLLFFAYSIVAVAVTAQPALDCWDLLTRGGITTSGSYTIYPEVGPAPSVQVWCDMETDGGGWTMLQRRFDGSLSFTRDMTEYEQGFGDVSGEHWIGLSWIYALTSVQGEVALRVDLCTYYGLAGYAVYDGFSISSPGDSYRLHAGTYRPGGSLVDMLPGEHNGMTFQTTGGCAEAWEGGWWYNECHDVNLNGGKYNSGSPYDGIVWWGFGNGSVGVQDWTKLLASEMKIRPVNATGDSSRPYTCHV